MHYRIVNCPEKAFRPYVKNAMFFFMDELVSNPVIKSECHINIVFNPSLSVQGYSSIIETPKTPRKFLIEINSIMGERYILSTLAHEMVHVKQYIQHEINDTLSTWCGDVVDVSDYWTHPWEIEAHGLEVGLLTKYVVKYKLWEVFENFTNPDDDFKYKPIEWKSKNG